MWRVVLQRMVVVVMDLNVRVIGSAEVGSRRDGFAGGVLGLGSM